MRATRFTQDAPRATLILAHPPSPDLSDCQLVQVPDAIFHLLRETPLLTCNISNNLISKIPPKLAMSFTLITGELVTSGASPQLELNSCGLTFCQAICVKCLGKCGGS